MSLSSLPTELLRQIIESSVPSTYHTTTYRKRQSTLCALCLVSRRFRLIAQPILRQIVSCRWSSGGALLKQIEEVQQWSMAVCQATIPLSTHGDLLELAVSSYSKVQELTVNAYPLKDDFCLLSHLSELRDLHIFCSRRTLPRFPPFASLRSFTLGWLTTGSVLDLQDLLRPSNFPSLQALALSHFLELDLLRIFRPPATLHLIEKLVSLFISVEKPPDALLDALKNVLSSTLITSSVDQAVAWVSALAQPIHFRIRDTPDEDNSEEQDEADCTKLAEIIETSTNSPLLSLYLDISLRSPFGNTSLMEAGGFRRLVEACDKRKVEVVYEKGPANWTIDPIISQEFWRRRRELRKAGDHGSSR